MKCGQSRRYLHGIERVLEDAPAEQQLLPLPGAYPNPCRDGGRLNFTLRRHGRPAETR